MIDVGSLIKEINKGVAKANAHFKKKGINAKAFNVDKVVIYENKNQRANHY